MPIEGRGRHLDPKQIPLKYRDIHLVEFKFCSDINPQQTLRQKKLPSVEVRLKRLKSTEGFSTCCAIAQRLISTAVDRKSAQPTSTFYPASTNKEPPRHLSKRKVTLHVLLEVGGTIYNQYTITPLLNLGILFNKVHQLATVLHCHSIKSLKKITKIRHKIQFNNDKSDRGSDGMGCWVSGWLQEG